MTGFNTRAIHLGSEPDPVTGAVNPPVFLTSTYAQDGVGVTRFSDYARVDNPTRAALEVCLAGLEEARHGVAFASGLAGEDALLRTLAPGDHVILGNDAYGGTYRLLTRVFGDWGLKLTCVDLSDLGAVPGPLDCYLLIRGLKTLGVRMERHCANARWIAAFLAGHEAVEHVYYPGLGDHPGHEVARSQMSDFGGMVSFTLREGAEKARRVCESTTVFTLAESLGGVESLIELPAVMTHASTTGSTLEPPANLIRLSVGIEDIDDLVSDLAQALA